MAMAMVMAMGMAASAFLPGTFELGPRFLWPLGPR